MDDMDPYGEEELEPNEVIEGLGLEEEKEPEW